MKRWTQAIAASDGFVIVSPEYNARVRRAIDYTNAVCGKAFATGFANLESAAQS
ncbi:NAD(P)H-dependent oxidoreductase [Paraburkholderia elongata]|uniref:NAD(P)H-dependent oxidoreductase n=1 Tax=Paraburkholderia elongata TaxID=2675747 RepID=UPI00155452C0|nr:NAD(P)H-dependent oxidoreductase [Paraburkholderia elongata]